MDSQLDEVNNVGLYLEVSISIKGQLLLAILQTQKGIFPSRCNRNGSAKKREVLVSVIEEKTQCLKRTADFMSSPRSARSKRIRMAKFVQGFNVQAFKCSLGLLRERFELISSIIPLQMAMYEAKRA